MQVLKRVLCPIDFSEYSKLALRYAAALAKDNEAELIVYHSVPDLTPAVSYLEGNYLITVHEAMVSNATNKLHDFVHEQSIQNVRVIERVGEGNPAESILALCKSEQIDIIVMGTHGLTGYERFLMGSTTNRVLHKATIPVLVVSKTSHHFVHENMESPVQIRKILCPVDFDSNNSWIAAVALSFARKYRSEIDFLHCVYKSPESNWDDLEKSAIRKLEEISAAAREENCAVRLMVRAGEPGEVIRRIAEAENTDLIVMGHHTRKPLEEVFLGSIAKRVVTNSKCPVLVARTLTDAVPHELILL